VGGGGEDGRDRRCGRNRSDGEVLFGCFLYAFSVWVFVGGWCARGALRTGHGITTSLTLTHLF